MLKLLHSLPRCSATTLKGRRCQMLVAGPGRRLCRYHDPELRTATIERNRAALRQYWQRHRAARALAKSAGEQGGSGIADDQE